MLHKVSGSAEYADGMYLKKLYRLLAEFEHLLNGAYHAFHARVTAVSKVLRNDHVGCEQTKMPYLEMFDELRKLALTPSSFESKGADPHPGTCKRSL